MRRCSDCGQELDQSDKATHPEKCVPPDPGELWARIEILEGIASAARRIRDESVLCSRAGVPEEAWEKLDRALEADGKPRGEIAALLLGHQTEVIRVFRESSKTMVDELRAERETLRAGQTELRRQNVALLTELERLQAEIVAMGRTGGERE